MSAKDFDLWFDTDPLQEMISGIESRVAEAVDAWEGHDRIRSAVIAKGIAGDIKNLCPRMPWRFAYALARFMVENTAEARQDARQEAAKFATAAEEVIR